MEAKHIPREPLVLGQLWTAVRWCQAGLSHSASPVPPHTVTHWLGSRASRMSWRQLEQITDPDMLQNEGLDERSHG